MTKTTKIKMPNHKIDYDIIDYVREPLAVFFKGLIVGSIVCEIVSVTIVVSFPNIKIENIIAVTQLSLTLGMVYGVWRVLLYFTRPELRV